jgi:hypothetical protein
MTAGNVKTGDRRAKGQGTGRTVVFVVLGALLCMVLPAWADVAPGEKIDQSNWQKVEGLVPDPVLDYVKKGEFILNIGKLTYDPQWEPEFLEASKANAGKYDIDADGGIVDPKTGERPLRIVGFPFSNIDQNDPKAGSKLLWNRWAAIFKASQNHFPYSVEWVGGRGFERSIKGDSDEIFYVSRPNELPNPEKTEFREISSVTSPASVEGFLQLTWRYLDNRPDSVWSYVPAMRRTRQLSSVNRSDPFLGSDFTSDDTFVWFGKNQSMEWKLVGQQDLLVPTTLPGPVPMVAGPESGSGTTWIVSKDYEGMKFGFDTPGWTGAQWAPTNVIWVKRPVWVIEAFPKDPYYSYGRQVLYLDRENAQLFFKVVYNRAGEYWKLTLTDFAQGWSPDGKHRFVVTAVQMAIDDKTHHAGIGTGTGTRPHGDSQGNLSEYNTARLKPEMFSVDVLLRRGK